MTGIERNVVSRLKEKPLTVTLEGRRAVRLPNFSVGSDLTVLCYGRSMVYRFRGKSKRWLLRMANAHDLSPRDALVAIVEASLRLPDCPREFKTLWHRVRPHPAEDTKPAG